MAKPPLNPLNEDGKEMSYFEKLVRMTAEYLKQDGITLNFAGYKETLVEYANLTEDDTAKAWQLARDINMWGEYFSSVANTIQKAYLNSETAKTEVQCSSSIQNDASKVANGDRLSNKDPNVVQARMKRNALKALYDELEAKVKFLERAHYHCKATCDWHYKMSTSYQGINHENF